ncbi:hypothetical protein [Undibacterium terreum]|uniref:Uncharacterized protein n=1 Tax=Undibacterium terreum TaxID=1224302 RepID=A0A916UKN0_9BURK|nr:hypothetical protein [Undibacterium terreum]GGC76211.1 hypothetical protein GCM10011396_24340 [Undibacterium terreum]
MRNPSLDIEKKLVLAKIRAGRVVMRQKLTRGGGQDAATTGFDLQALLDLPMLRLVRQHPAWAGVAVAAVLFLGPRKLVGGFLKTGIAVVGGLLSSPANLSLIMRIFPQLFPAIAGFMHSLQKQKIQD